MPTHYYNDTWGTFIGSQSAAEFMSNSTDHAAPYSDAEITTAVHEYLATLEFEWDDEGKSIWDRFDSDHVADDLIDDLYENL